ncbi:unnamed protein product [Microthlaspi erraticum]|uniref:Uncharacterized protein n=1 Tax=Microthlaspi erraticum TaxID=1685480 RepID=A0A6D2HM54_9BRAS|nr:unnamed protein product [Microthlaspi erraticum]
MMRRCLVTRRRVVLLLARTSVLRVTPEFQRMVLRAIILTRSRRGGMAGVLLWRTRMLAEGRLGCLKFIPAWGFRVRSSPLGPISTKLLNIILCLAGSSPRWSRSTRRRFGQLRTKPLCCGGAGDGQDVDTMVADLQQDKLALESKVAALNREIVKTLGLQVADKLRAQVSDLEEKARRDAEASAAEMERLRRSRRESVEAAVTQVFDSVNDWYAPRLHRLSEFVAQRDMVEAAVGRRQVDEALLNFVKKIRGVDLNFDAVEEKLAAKLAKSIADGDAIDEVVIDDDDFAPPNSLKRLVLPGSPSRRDGDGADPGAGPSTSGAKSA